MSRSYGREGTVESKCYVVGFRVLERGPVLFASSMSLLSLGEEGEGGGHLRR